MIASACASSLDDAPSADDIQVAVPKAKIALQRVKAKGDASLKMTQTPRFEQPMTVVLELAGDPVAKARAQAPGMKLATSAKLNIEAQLRSYQDSLVPSIEARGGTVLAKFQNAINGIKVRATPDKIAALATLPGVVSVKTVGTYKRLNSISVPFIGAPHVWATKNGFRGEHVKVAIVDTGIDFTHANFGGPGTPDAYNAAFAADTQPADPALFGPNAPKVKGGIDLVGDDYDPSNPQATPQPDPNPLDCGAHGTHVAGTVAGFGVLADGTTFKGPYDASTPGQRWMVGPGVAPEADLYAVRVFGCGGSTNVIVDALDWAVQNDMQVVNMSLGSPFGSAGDADAEASENAAKAGIIVVAAAGNEGAGNYITGSPAAGDKVISVAAMDSNDPKSYPGVNLSLANGAKVVAQNSNNAQYNGTPLAVYVLPDGQGGVSLGCDEAEYVDANIAGKLVIAQRGTCARVLRAQLGFKHGAAAVALINNGPGYPYFEGDIQTLDNSAVVTIPFLGIQTKDAGALVGTANAMLADKVDIADPLWHAFADFSSGGPRTGDGKLKPDVSAPGVNITSSYMGSGNQGAAFSGTSMATPHVTGVAALALQAHPDWSSDDVRTAILNTADASQIIGYQVRLGGAGLVQPYPASRTWAVAADAETGAANLSFGAVEFDQDFQRTKTLHVRNYGAQALRFQVSATAPAGSPAQVSVQPSVLWVQAGGSGDVQVQLTIPAKTSGDTNDFREVAGLVQLKPSKGWNGDAVLSVPYYAVPRARSLTRLSLSASFGPHKPSANAKVYNDSSKVTGTADFYALGLVGKNQKAAEVGLRAVGVQSNPMKNGDSLLYFAINTFKPWSNAASTEFDVLIDNDGDGKMDYAIVATDVGYLTTGTPVGQMVTAVININTGAGAIQYPVAAPTDNATLLIPVVATDIGVTPGAPRFSYTVQSFSVSGATDVASGWAKFNPYTSAISTGGYLTLAPGKHGSVPVSIDVDEWKLTPALGLMVVGMDNYDSNQARLFTINGN
ncbi:MAG: S8 family serine peptidase [Myxococcales bacterium]